LSFFIAAKPRENDMRIDQNGQVGKTFQRDTVEEMFGATPLPCHVIDYHYLLDYADSISIERNLVRQQKEWLCHAG
jgi:hypothetical protein